MVTARNLCATRLSRFLAYLLLRSPQRSEIIIALIALQFELLCVQTRTSNNHPKGTSDLLGEKAALVIGHPGHELRVHHWLEIARPLTFVLTDGSGREQRSRLPSTVKILRETGAKPAPIFGLWTDAKAYEILLTGNLDALIEVIRDLTRAFLENGIRAVAADAMEGFNPTHDLCRCLANAAILIAEREAGYRIANFDFPLVGAPNAAPADLRNRCVRLEVDEQALARKRAAAENYPEMKAEVEAAISRFGLEVFAIELFRPVTSGLALTLSGEPFYETHGENRVKEGHYAEVIRYRQHVAPLLRALWDKLGLPA